VELAAAMAALPARYAEALRLRDAGFAGADLARRLEVDEAVVASILELAAAKLATLLDAPE